MRKVVIHRRGGYERLGLEECDSPPLPSDGVRIKVAAAGLNYADCIVRMGLYASARELVGWPITPGFEVSGVITEVGDDVEDREVDEEVIAVTLFGGYASEIVVPESQVFDVPHGFSMIEAAAFPAVSLTADYALNELARPRPGATILVHSAAGGVGTALCQIAANLGCKVVGVVGQAYKGQYAREAGANAVIDKSEEDLWAAAESHAPDGYDAIFDANGVSTLKQSYRHIAPTGRLIVYGFASMIPRADERFSWLRLGWHWLRTPRFDPLALTNENKSVMGFNLSYLFNHAELLAKSMTRLLALARDDAITPPPIREYTLEEVAEAQRDIESGSTVGKLVLIP